MQIRQRAAEARVVITNHHLLISDLRLRTIGGVALPDTELIVCDEAHHIEDVATSIFETTVTDYTVPSLLLRRLVREHTPTSKLEELAAQNRAFFDRVMAQMDQQSVKLTGDWEEGIRLGRSVRDLAESLARLNPYDDDPDMEEENTRFGLAVQAVRRAGEDLLTVSRSNKDDQTGALCRASAAAPRQPRPARHARSRPPSRWANTCLAKTRSSAPRPRSPQAGTFVSFKARCGLDGQPQPPEELIGEPGL